MHLFKPKGKRCICCCFCDVCSWAVFLLLHILFSAEQVQIFCIIYAHRGAECNIYCCFFDACPWAVFLLLHILFSTEQIQDFLHNLCLQVGNCNICCCFYFCIVCPWAVFILLHILFSAEQVFVPLYLCLQGCYVFVHVFHFIVYLL